MKVAAGQPFRPRARQWNEFIDAARTLQQAERDQTFELELPEHSQTRTLIKNESGSPWPRFAVVGLGEPWKTPAADLPQFQRQLVFRGHAPLEASDPFAILLEPLAPGGIGEAVLAGVAITQVNVVRELDPFAEVVAGNTTSLRSAPHGRTRILWKPPGTGVLWCVVRISDRPRFAVFELPSRQWQTGGAGEPTGWAKMPGCRPVFYFRDDETYLADQGEATETVWHQVGYPPHDRDNLIALHHSTGLLPARFGERDWVWCFWNDYESRWQILASYEDHWRFQLIEPLSRCGQAAARLVLYDAGAYCPVNLVFTVVDSIGIVWPEATSGSATVVTIPAETYGVAKHFADSGQWEVLALGEGCCPQSSASSGSSSPSSHSSASSARSIPSSRSSSLPSSTPSSQPSLPSVPPSSQPPSSDPSTGSTSPQSVSPGPCIDQLGGLRFDQIPGYTSSGRQVLLHNNGCLEWITVRSCDAPSSPSAQPGQGGQQ